MELILIIALTLIILLMGIQIVREKRIIRNFKKRFSPILNIDMELETVRKEIKEQDIVLKNKKEEINNYVLEQKTIFEKEKTEILNSLDSIKKDYLIKKNTFDELVKEVAIYDEEIELAELGFYKPHFDFDTSENYKQEISNIRTAQKKMLSEKTAIYCTTDWTVDGNKAKGRTLINRAIRLTARAFNNECDSAISSVRWNNANRMEQRIQKAFEAINKLNESNQIIIDEEYLDLKIKELELSHEYREKKQQEKEEKAEIRRQLREEATLQKEVEKALNDERKYEQLLEKAKKEAEQASDDKLMILESEITKLTQELENAHSLSERALSMAQQTKSGHIYIISNIGSFGEDIYKIGMTRRLDPLDRVKELGDASVPFLFDIHTIIYTEDAPALEKQLHQVFDSKRVNLVNNRKEFFKVTLDEIKIEVKKHFPEAEISTITEAREYKETIAIASQRNDVLQKNETSSQFPDEL